MQSLDLILSHTLNHPWRGFIAVACFQGNPYFDRKSILLQGSFVQSMTLVTWMSCPSPGRLAYVCFSRIAHPKNFNTSLPQALNNTNMKFDVDCPLTSDWPDGQMEISPFISRIIRHADNGTIHCTNIPAQTFCITFTLHTTYSNFALPSLSEDVCNTIGCNQK